MISQQKPILKVIFFKPSGNQRNLYKKNFAQFTKLKSKQVDKSLTQKFGAKVWLQKGLELLFLRSSDHLGKKV